MTQIAVSPDSRYIAEILPDGTCYVSDVFAAMRNDCYSSFISLPQKVKLSLSQIEHIRWSPERIETPYDTADGENRVLRNTIWLLLTGTSRMFVLELQIPDSLAAYPLETRLVADIEFPSSHGKISAIDFVFNHNSILIMFDIMPNAALLSLTNAQRDDLPNRKFTSQQSYALSKDTRSVAILVRNMHTDYVAVFQSGQLTKSFKLDTMDAQGIVWSPDGRPFLCTWDSAAYGPKAQFYTALGHRLKQFDLVSQSFSDINSSSDLSGSGVSVLNWSSQGGSRNNNIFIVGYGFKHILMRLQNSLSLSIENTCSVSYPDVLNGSTTMIWQQIDTHSYRQEPGLWNLPESDFGEIVSISTSADGQRIATVATDSPNIVVIWQFGCTAPISAIIFQKDVRHISWHPSHATVLITSIADRTSHLQIWSGRDVVPHKATIPKLQDVSSSKWQFKWLTQIQNGERYDPLMISSTSHFDIGYLEISGNGTVFKSLFPPRTAPSSDESTLFF